MIITLNSLKSEEKEDLTPLYSDIDYSLLNNIFKINKIIINDTIYKLKIKNQIKNNIKVLQLKNLELVKENNKKKDNK